MINLDEIQQLHKLWEKRNFGNQPAYRAILGIMEEAGELAHAFLKMEQGIRINENHEENIVDAVGDIVMYIISFCNKMNISLESTIYEVWYEIRQRNWKEYREDGKTK